jgi:hypothetical protein
MTHHHNSPKPTTHPPTAFATAIKRDIAACAERALGVDG